MDRRVQNQTFQQVSNAWLESLPTKIRRNGKPLAPNSIRIYTHCAARLNEHLGKERLPISNKRLKEYVAALRAEGYSDSSIVGDLTAYTLAVESVTDANGDAIYPVKINHEFVGTPLIRPLEQRGQCATQNDIERALTIPELAGIVAIAAGSGLRISEILALEYGGSRDSWDPVTSTICIRATLKTPSARRDIPVCKDLNDYLASTLRYQTGARLFDIPISTIYASLRKHGLQPMHSFRRYRITQWERSGMNSHVCLYLSGHSKGSSVHERYVRVSDDADFIRSEVNRVDLGFSLPTEERTHDAAALKYHGEFAALNFPREAGKVKQISSENGR